MQILRFVQLLWDAGSDFLTPRGEGTMPMANPSSVEQFAAVRGNQAKRDGPIWRISEDILMARSTLDKLSFFAVKFFHKGTPKHWGLGGAKKRRQKMGKVPRCPWEMFLNNSGCTETLRCGPSPSVGLRIAHRRRETESERERDR